MVGGSVYPKLLGAGECGGARKLESRVGEGALGTRKIESRLGECVLEVAKIESRLGSFFAVF